MRNASLISLNLNVINANAKKVRRIAASYHLDDSKDNEYR